MGEDDCDVEDINIAIIPPDPAELSDTKMT